MKKISYLILKRSVCVLLLLSLFLLTGCQKEVSKANLMKDGGLWRINNSQIGLGMVRFKENYCIIYGNDMRRPSKATYQLRDNQVKIKFSTNNNMGTITLSITVLPFYFTGKVKDKYQNRNVTMLRVDSDVLRCHEKQEVRHV